MRPWAGMTASLSHYGQRSVKAPPCEAYALRAPLRSTAKVTKAAFGGERILTAEIAEERGAD
jgi:hypothetical protein